jgi:tetratricopeptide (TPR) repeat protein
MAENQTLNVVPTDYERLVRFVTQPGQEFALAIVRYADPNVRDRLIERIQQDAEHMGVRVKRLDLHDLPDDANLLETISSNLEPKGEPPIQAVFVVRFEHALVDPLGAIKVAPSIHGFNIARDQLPARVRTRLVLWLSDAATNAFADQARDLYDVVVAFFRFDDRDEPRAVHSYRDTPEWMRFAPAKDIPKLRREAALLESVFEGNARLSTRAEAAARIGQIEILTGNAEVGQSWLERALELYQVTGNITDAVGVCMQLGDYSLFSGDFDTAIKSFERANELAHGVENLKAVTVSAGRIADVFEIQGKFDEAMRIRTEQEIPFHEKSGDSRGLAIVMAKIANILEAQGQLDVVLEIRTKLILPVFEQFGDVREVAVTKSKIADIFEARGQLDEALKIRKEQLEVYEKLGDIRSTALIWGQIADVYYAQGQFDQALKIRTEQELPILEKLGDIRSIAIVKDQIADVYQTQGQIEKAFRIMAEQMPIYEKIGDLREAAITRGKMADILWREGKRDQAIDIYQKENLPTYRQLGDKKNLSVNQTNLAQMLLIRGQPDDIPEARDLLNQALQAAQEMQIPEAQVIQDLITKYFGPNA